MTDHPATFLGFDYGDRLIGVAVGQSVTATANPLGCVRVTGGRPDWDAIAGLLRTWEPDALVVGLPLKLDGGEQAATRAARSFSAELERRFRLPVHAADERLSTVEARRRLAEAGRPDEEDDPMAAQIILEAWLGERQRAAR